MSVTWYDLPARGAERYMGWLHEQHIPMLLKQPRVLWAAHYKTEKKEKPLSILRHTKDKTVPAGTSYIFMLGAEDAHAFSPLTREKLGRKLGARDRNMLEMRMGERSNIFTEEARAHGPAVKRREGKFTPAPCIQLGSFNSGSYADEDELLSWYADFRLPGIRTLPGAIALRKLASVSGWAKHGVMYEFTSLEDRAANFRAHEAKDKKLLKWTHEVVAKLVHSPGSPHVAQRIWPPVKGRRA